MTEFPILQFGASRFLQAHVDLFVSEALPRGDAMGRIAVAGTTGSPESRRRVAAFAGGKPYPVLVKGLSDGAVVDERVEVSSVGAGFDAATQWDELERLFIAARCAVSNTADRGYETDPDDRPDAAPPRSFPAKLAKLLLARHHASAKPITLFPCELTPANGKVLRGVVLDVLDRWQASSSARKTTPNFLTSSGCAYVAANAATFGSIAGSSGGGEGFSCAPRCTIIFNSAAGRKAR